MERVTFVEPDLDDRHECGYREAYYELKEFVEIVLAGQQLDIQKQNEALEQQRQAFAQQREEFARERSEIRELLERLGREKFGPRSERSRRKKEPAPELSEEEKRQKRAASDAKRRRNREEREQLPEVKFTVELPEEQRCCPGCDSRMDRWASPKKKTIYAWVPGHLERRTYQLETLSCRVCQEVVVSAPPPRRPFQGLQSFDAGFVAEVVVRKCADALPLHRLRKSFRRDGLAISESTLGRIFQEAGRHLAVVWERMCELVAKAPLVQADETFLKLSNHPTRQEGSLKTCYIWVFIDADSGRFVYIFSVSRSGETPSQILGAGAGVLVVDAYTGYNDVTSPEGWTRAGCNAHARRKFVDLLGTFTTEAEQALEFYRRLYAVEHQASEEGITRSEEHLALRREKSAPIMEEFKDWLERSKKGLPPTNSLLKAIGYCENNWTELTRFLEDAQIPLDNNLSERTLRPWAVGRKNWLHIGNEEAGKNSAILHTLVRNCEACGVNPWLYIADLVMKTPGELRERVDDFLPWTWRPPDGVREGQAYPAYPPGVLVTRDKD